MSEKRRPEIKFVAEFPGKDGKTRRMRIELYHANQWSYRQARYLAPSDAYRVRFDGKWWNLPNGKWKFLTLSQFFDTYRRSMTAARKRYRRLPKKTL